MDFDALNAWVPYVSEGKPKSRAYHPYPGITLGMPGRHADQTSPPGGDFVVCVTDDTVGWKKHQFTHGDIFIDLEFRPFSSAVRSTDLMQAYLRVVKYGMDPLLDPIVGHDPSSGLGNVIRPLLFLQAVQCLAVAEHRRYARYENQFGGRYLPFRFGAGIEEGLWTAGQAIEKQKKGRPGVEHLEREHGIPFLTQELMRTDDC
jgi:hypothetical protein